MGNGDYVKIVAGDHTGVYGRIYESRPNFVFVEFAQAHNGFTGAAFSRNQLILLSKKEYFKAVLCG